MSGLFVSRFSSRRRRLAIAQSSQQDKSPANKDASPQRPVQATLNLREKLTLTRPLTWVFLGGTGTLGAVADSAFSPVGFLSRAVKNQRIRQQDIFVDATNHSLKFSNLVLRCDEVLSDYRPDLVTIFCEDAFPVAVSNCDLRDAEECLLESVRKIQDSGGVPICCTPFLALDVDGTSETVDLAIATIRNVTKELDAFLVDFSSSRRLASQTHGEDLSRSVSPELPQAVTMNVLFRDLLTELDSISHSSESGDHQSVRLKGN